VDENVKITDGRFKTFRCGSGQTTLLHTFRRCY